MPVMLDDNDPNKTEKPVDPSFCVCIERNPNDWVLCDGHKWYSYHNSMQPFNIAKEPVT